MKTHRHALGPSPERSGSIRTPLLAAALACLLLPACGNDAGSGAAPNDSGAATHDASGGGADGSGDAAQSDAAQSDAAQLDAGAAQADAGATDAGAGAPTWAQVHGTIVKPVCSNGYCHGSGSGSLKLTGDAATDYATLTTGKAGAKDAATCAVASYVVAGKPAESLLWLKVDKQASHGCGQKMPSTTGGLEAAQSDLIKGWIAAGAKQ